MPHYQKGLIKNKDKDSEKVVLKTKNKSELPKDPKLLRQYIEERLIRRLWGEAIGKGPKSTSASRVKALELLMKKFEGEDAQRSDKHKDENSIDFSTATPEELRILKKFFGGET